jgi:hypothetical protein
MKKEIAEMLVDFNPDLQLYGNYFGRGMYGETTTAITCDNIRDFFYAVGDLMYEMILDAMHDGEEYDTSDAEELRNLLSNFRQDSLGMGVIIY